MDRRAETAAIDEMVETYRRGFATLDPGALLSIWDPEYDLIYCPIELSEPVRGIAGLAGYYDRVTRHFRRVQLMEIDDLSICVLGDAAFAFFAFRFEGEPRAGGELHRVQGRNTIILRRVAATWRAIHYHESRMGPY
jgi:ketosteroid isomerase-like protein